MSPGAMLLGKTGPGATTPCRILSESRVRRRPLRAPRALAKIKNLCQILTFLTISRVGLFWPGRPVGELVVAAASVFVVCFLLTRSSLGPVRFTVCSLRTQKILTNIWADVLFFIFNPLFLTPLPQIHHSKHANTPIFHHTKN